MQSNIRPGLILMPCETVHDQGLNSSGKLYCRDLNAYQIRVPYSSYSHSVIPQNDTYEKVLRKMFGTREL